jgi:Histidine kinase-, DNA gyrase B-, and HSP90-like ATPase
MSEPLHIDASPTKELFIRMLVRDIPLVRALVELVDNSVDGARRVRGGNGTFEGLTVRLTLTKDRCEVQDNCGGIAPDLARDYAFRFGRPEGMPSTPGSIGNFGVGMKRALFKMGRHFAVVSRSSQGSFDLIVNVDEWSASPAWDFTAESEREPCPPSEAGTSIIVEELYEGVAEQFGLETFVTQLTLTLENAQQHAMSRGLQLSVNGQDVPTRVSTVLASEELRPAQDYQEYAQIDGPPVAVRLIAGIGDSAPADAGWYVYCNGRMVLRADRTSVTGWGDEALPQYHNQYARFRGFAYFDCENPGALPWNTTKTGVDEENSVYRATRLRMGTLARPIFGILNRLKDEVESDTVSRPLADTLEGAGQSNVQNLLPSVRTVAPFQLRPRSAPSSQPRTRSVQFAVATKRLNRAMARLRVTTLREVGERTFDYYYVRECED